MRLSPLVLRGCLVLAAVCHGCAVKTGVCRVGLSHCIAALLHVQLLASVASQWHSLDSLLGPSSWALLSEPHQEV